MGYVAVQGGITAIENSQSLNRYLRMRGSSLPLSIAQIMDQMGPLVDRVMSEGGLYSPFHAALAVKQASGDPIEASFLVRAYRSTLRRMVDSLPIRSDRMRILRRISSAFKTIPGGQVLGSTSDYEQRILDFSLARETEETRREVVQEFDRSLASGALSDAAPLDPQSFRKVVDLLREQGLVPPAQGRAADAQRLAADAQPLAADVQPLAADVQGPADPTQTAPAAAQGPAAPTAGPAPTDITQHSAELPLDRSGRLQMLARAETGGVLALAYSSMRGYGSVHPTIAELRVGHVRVEIPHPFRPGETVTLGSILITEVEIVASVQRTEAEEKPAFSLGYGACFGHNEVKAISMAVLDRAMKTDSPHAPAEDQEFVLLHTDGIESSGFCSHFKLPHYVTFQADLDRLRDLRGNAE